MERVAQGGTVLLTAVYKTGAGDLVDVADAVIDIIDANGVTLVVNAPATHVSLGNYRYSYAVPVTGPVGVWRIHWTGTIEGFDAGGDDWFQVVTPGSLVVPPAGGVCTPWASESDECVGSACATYEFDPLILSDALQLASDVLFDLSGRKWPGECSETVRPCGEGGTWVSATSFAGWRSPSPYPSSPWGNLSMCGCNRGRSCGCRRPSEIRLPGSPVVSIEEVKVDGVILDSARYRVDDYRWLVYLPEEGSSTRGWPCCQDVTLDDGEEGTWSVRYTYGSGPPLGGVRAAADLACQLALACVGNEACALPKRITSITRQGVSLAVLDPLTLFDEGRTGLSAVDLWLSSLRVGNARRPATIHVPGQQARFRRTTIPAGA